MDSPSLELPPTKQSGDGPLVSIVLATYEPDLEQVVRSIESVGDQTYDNVQLVVIDSSGLEWLRRLRERHDWITYRHQEPAGLPAAWNAGIETARGTYVGFLADDDYYDSEKLERQVSALEEGYDLVYSDEYVIQENGEVTYLSSLPVDDPERHYIDFFRSGQGVPHLTVVGRTDCFEAEPFDEELDVREDPHLWVRLFEQYSMTRVQEGLAYKRLRDESATSDPDLMYENERREIELLCEEYPELREYRDEREQMARYRYGKQLFNAGRIGEARSVSFGLLRNGMIDHRVLALLGISLLPAKNAVVFRILQRAQERLRS